MEDPQRRQVHLRVAEAKPEDAGRGFARLNRRARSALGVQTGDPVEAHGGDVTVATAAPAYPEDEERDIVRLDASDRWRAGLEPGRTAVIRPSHLRTARRLVLAPVKRFVRIATAPDVVKRLLIGRVLAPGELLMIPVHPSPSTLRLRLLGIDLVEVARGRGKTDGTLLRVVAAEPTGRVRVDHATTIRFQLEHGHSDPAPRAGTDRGADTGRPGPGPAGGRRSAPHGRRRSLRLRVARSRVEDVGSHHARIGRMALAALGLVEGDVIEVVAPHRTIRMPAAHGYAADEGLDFIRLEAAERERAGVAVGDTVEVRRAQRE